jgi:hypothetical protein
MANEPIKPDPTAPAASPDAPAEPTAPKYMTPEDFNGAMTARERRFEQRIAKMLEERFQAFTPASAKAAVEEETEPTEPTTPAAQPDKSSKDVLRLKDEVAKMKKERAREREEIEKERNTRLVSEANAQVQAALSESGAAGPHNKAAWALLHAEGKIKRNDAGEVCIELPRTYLGKTELELVPVKEAIPEWLNSDAGKLFMPPRGGGDGSGTTIKGGAPRAGGKLTKEEAKREAAQAVAAWAFGPRP